MKKEDAAAHQLLGYLLEEAKKSGATAADAVLSDSSSVSVTRRLGKQESLVRAEESEIGLRVFTGRRQAIVSSSDKTPEALREMAARAVAMARAVPEDAFSGVADPSELASSFPDLELYDATELSVTQMNELADRAEEAARGVKGVTNSEGADCSFGKDMSYYAASNGFMQGYASSGFNLSVSVIAGQETSMERDYEYDSKTFFSDLGSPESMGRAAGERAVRALHPKKPSTRKIPVVFDSRISGGLIGSLAGAISGSSVARGTTILKDKLGRKVFAEGITITDDPFMRRGMRSHPFDGEGVAPQKRNLIENGVLTGWVLDLRSARQLGLQTTGNASRGTGSPPSPAVSNFYMHAGKMSVEALIKEIDEGFFITRFLGSGGNILTGDYSRGAQGFWIEKGQITHAVSEATVAGNLAEMWMNATPADDLQFKTGIDAPSLRIEGMMVAGA